MTLSGEIRLSAALLLGKISRFLVDRRLGGRQCLSECGDDEKNSWL
jgi:hypothetical protein